MKRLQEKCCYHLVHFLNFKPSGFGKGSHSQFQCWDHESIRIFSQVSLVKLAFWNMSRLHDRQKGGSLCDRRKPFGIPPIRKGKQKHFCGSSCLREMLAAMYLRTPSLICMFVSGATATEYRLLWRWLRIYSTAIPSSWNKIMFGNSSKHISLLQPNNRKHLQIAVII